MYHEEEVAIFNQTLIRGIADDDLSDLIVNVKENLDFIPSSLDFASFPTFLSKKFGLVYKTDKDYVPLTKAKYDYFKALVSNVAKNYYFGKGLRTVAFESNENDDFYVSLCYPTTNDNDQLFVENLFL